MANERARQKRLERKRRKREERRRALRAEPADSAGWGPPPMSLTLKRFAEPLLDRLPDKTNPDDWKLVLSWAAMVWNAADDGPYERVLALGREVFGSLGWQDDVAEEVRRLRSRKAQQFQWEPRMVARVDVEDRGDTMHVVALSVLA